MSKVEATFSILINPEFIGMIGDRAICIKICKLCDTDDKVGLYFRYKNFLFYKEMYFDDIISAYLSKLKVKVFGNKRLELSSFIQLKRTIAQMKFTPSHGVKAQKRRFMMFQDYLLGYL